MLVLGYRGTLQPDTTSDSGETPPQMAALLQPQLQQALAELNHRLPSEQRYFQGEPIPVDALLSALRQRLEEILTLPLAEYLATANEDRLTETPQLNRLFPALNLLLRQAVFDWATATAVFCRRLQRDSSRLAQWLGLDTIPPVASLTATTSDMHPGGHLVLRVLFRNGSCIFYKPRPLTGEWLWHALLESIAAADPKLRLPAARVLLGARPERYGWMESVLPHASSPSPQNTPSYWHNAGAMLFLASQVRLSDLHLGNVIATPNGPAVTDAECLATPNLSDPPFTAGKFCGSPFKDTLQSILDTGLLPCKSNSTLPDISGLFGSAAKVPALHLPQWSCASEGKPLLKTTTAALLDHGNSPGSTSPLAVIPHLVMGYRHAAEALLLARNNLLAQESSWRQLLFCCHAPRVVLRDTLAYALLLSASLNPTHLRSAQQRRYALRAALHPVARTHLPPSVLRAELHSLLHLHIPRLILLPGTQTLAGASGTPLARRFAKANPALEVITRINDLCTENIEAVHTPALISALLPQTEPA